MPPQTSGKKLLAELSGLMRRLHYSIHTERAYCDRVARFVRFHQLESCDALCVDAESKMETFLTHLAVQGRVAASTQNQVFNALVFLFTRVLEWLLESVSATRSPKEVLIKS